MEVAKKSGSVEKRKWSPPALPRSPWAAARPAVRSVTRDEIERFWRRKRMEEEDHLLAALKAAARIRARTLKEEEHRQFQASLEGILSSSNDETIEDTGGKNKNQELRAIIRDWWTKSKYAYLNQPAIQSMDPEAKPNGTSFIPNSCFYGVVPAKPSSPLGVF